MKKKNIIIKIAVCIVVALFITTLVISSQNTIIIEEIPYSEARAKLTSSEITSVKFEESTLIAKLYIEGSNTIYKTKVPSAEVFSDYMNEIMESNKIVYEIEEGSSSSSFWSNFFGAVILLGPSICMLAICMRNMDLNMQVNSLITEKTTKRPSREIHTAKINRSEEPSKVSVQKTQISFKDVAGIDKEKAEVEEVVNMLKNPEKYNEIGAKIPKGILFTGAPGTGKTLLAKAIATEAKVSFISCDGSIFENTYVGVGAEKMRNLFELAKECTPAIIFIDEIDVIAQKRYTKTNSSHEQTLNQLLTLMDGFDESEKIVVIAATNTIEVLDSAITRPGRFDRIINIPLPDKKGRKEILDVHARNKKFGDDKEELLLDLAKKTYGMSGAELANILNEAAIMAVRDKKDFIGKQQIDEAFIKVVLGISKDDKEVSLERKKLVAVHEAGHAIVSRVKDPKKEIIQVSIIPRGEAGGYNLYNIDEINTLPTKEELENGIMVSLGGRAAENLVYNTISVGASNDLEKVTKLAHEMIYKYAMGEDAQMVRIFGKEDFNDKLETEMFPYVKAIVDRCYKETLKIIEEKKELLKALSDMLVEKSTLNTSELEELFSQYGI